MAGIILCAHPTYRGRGLCHPTNRGRGVSAGSSIAFDWRTRLLFAPSLSNLWLVLASSISVGLGLCLSEDHDLKMKTLPLQLNPWSSYHVRILLSFLKRLARIVPICPSIVSLAFVS